MTVAEMFEETLKQSYTTSKADIQPRLLFELEMAFMSGVLLAISQLFGDEAAAIRAVAEIDKRADQLFLDARAAGWTKPPQSCA